MERYLKQSWPLLQSGSRATVESIVKVPPIILLI
jgi:hypothetical protein